MDTGAKVMGHVDDVGVSRFLKGDARPAVEEEVHGQPDRLLAAHRDQDLIRPRQYAPAWQQLGANLIDQKRIVGVRLPGRPGRHVAR